LRLVGALTLAAGAVARMEFVATGLEPAKL
jgi:hypothetical protein